VNDGAFSTERKSTSDCEHPGEKLDRQQLAEPKLSKME
jgi:hypothetical protein